MSRLLKGRDTYRPFYYEKAYEYWLKQQQAHWLHTEVGMSGDLQDWKFKLTDAEKSVLGGVLKGFIQAEVVVNEYWSQYVAKWFPHPEIVAMASAFASTETIHIFGYAHLNDSLGIEDYDAFLDEPAARAKIDRLMGNLDDHGERDLGQIARSLAVFSAFTEGVSLFSSFAVLANFSRFGKMMGVSQIIRWSSKDEDLHAEAGCWLFRTLIEENPHLWTDELKKDLYDAARATVALEDAFIDKVFELGDIEGLTAYDLKQFVRNRANIQLGDIGLKKNWEDLDNDALERMSWFDDLVAGEFSQDFFAGRVTEYSTVSEDFEDMW